MINEKKLCLEDMDDVLIPTDVAKYLHLSPNSVYMLLHEGAIKSIRIGHQYRIPKQYILEFLENFSNIER
ncbi:MAG: helix-turn-helix domain-containing protein [Lachnospiraceae bacterium]|nr:helix-turn-helix domain-containing protein [Lachnospiraceae bacterium]